MVIPFWALLNLYQTDLEGGFTITTITDVACHQWLRHTLKPPWSHPKPVLRRGVFMQYDAQFCFVAYEDLEQNEPGDTFVHTFTWPGWVDCQTGYFYFWAVIDAWWSPSTSPIFSKHYTAPPPLVKVDYHEAPLDSYFGYSHGYFYAQSFTPEKNYELMRLSLPLKRSNVAADGIWHIQIRTKDDWHPSETVLWETIMNVAAMPVHPDWAWFHFNVPALPLLKDIPYWIVCFRTNWTVRFFYPHILGDSGDLYTRGEHLYAYLSAGPWHGQSEGYDLGFITWELA